MPETYDLYVTDTVIANAMAIGSQNPIVVVGSPLLGRLGPGEQRALLAHEVAHILSDHVLYNTALQILLRAGGNIPFPLAIPAAAVRAVLLEWSRAAELSCDRAQALVVRDPTIVCRGLMALAGGMHSDRLNFDAFLAQAREYEDWDDPSDRVRRFFYEINATHPYAVRRVSEVMRWVQSGEYDRIQRGEYIRRGEEPPVQRGGRRRVRVLRRALPRDLPRHRRQRHPGGQPARRPRRAGGRLAAQARRRGRRRRLAGSRRLAESRRLAGRASRRPAPARRRPPPAPQSMASAETLAISSPLS